MSILQDVPHFTQARSPFAALRIGIILASDYCPVIYISGIKVIPVKSPETDLLIPEECFCFSGFYDIKNPGPRS